MYTNSLYSQNLNYMLETSWQINMNEGLAVQYTWLTYGVILIGFAYTQ
jgi:hypothetical protein